MSTLASDFISSIKLFEYSETCIDLDGCISYVLNIRWYKYKILKSRQQALSNYWNIFENKDRGWSRNNSLETEGNEVYMANNVDGK